MPKTYQLHGGIGPFFRWFSLWIFLVISFCVVGFLLVAKATGYRYNQQVGHWQKTGMIIATSNTGGAHLVIDDQSYPLTNNTRVANLLPGNYRVKAMATGFQDWTESVSIESGFVVNLAPITLFRKEPIVSAATPKQVTRLADTLPDDRIQLTDGELWYDHALVSRFAVAPSDAVLFPTKHQIIYNLDDQIRVIDITGDHDLLLYKRGTTSATRLVLDGETLLFNDIDGPKAMVIR